MSRGALVLLIVVSRIPLRPLEDQRLEKQRLYDGVCRLVAPGLLFRWEARGLEGGGAGGSRGALVLFTCFRVAYSVSASRPREAKALSLGLSLGGSRAFLQVASSGVWEVGGRRLGGIPGSLSVA